MTDFPPPGPYHIRSSQLGCFLGFLEGHDALRGLPTSSDMWELSYVDFPKGLCVFSQIVGGTSSLGVYDISDKMPVYSVDVSQVWVLKKAEDGGIAEADDKTYAWYLSNVGEPVVLENSVPWQTWQFTSSKDE